MKTNFIKEISALCLLLAANCAIDEGKNLHYIMNSSNAIYCSNSLCGDGTQANPYRVYNDEQLTQVHSNLSAYYILRRDIDVRASWSEGTPGCISYDGTNGPTATCEGFEPIGTDSDGDRTTVDGTEFTGGLDGNGFAINNLYTNRPTTDHIAFFGKTIGARVRNISIRGTYIRGRNFVGSLVGQNGGLIENSAATAASVEGNEHIGGLVGTNSDAIRNSYTSGTVTGVGSGGGLAGSNTGNISNSYATGDVTLAGVGGGLVGFNASSTAIINNSYATGNLTIENTGGGLVGNNQDNAQVMNSYATGTVTCAALASCTNLGGFAGLTFLGATVSGTNYFVDTIIVDYTGINPGGATANDGIGDGDCATGAACQSVTNIQTIFNALFLAASTSAPYGLGWQSADWGDRMTTHPCIAAIPIRHGGCL